ncbi:MAG TPA: hypothetical protein DCF84_00335, partial [Bacteroidetes bacterium]|nr:hypothetical protein [Bacteroidota bacterium]
ADADPTNELTTGVVLNGTDLEVTDAGGTISTDLSSLVDDADADPSNELQNLSINAANDSVLISDGQGIALSSIDTDDQNLDSAILNTDSTLSVFIQDGASTTVDLASLFDNTDAQTISLDATGSLLTISNGNTVTLVDADSTNELQTLIVDRITDSLYISGTNGDTLMGIDLNDVITCVIPPQNLTYATLIGDTLEIDIEGGDSVRVDLSSLGSNNLDDAYDQGGPGVGREIFATDSGVLISGTDGLYVTGSFGSGSEAEVTGPGTRMFFNPRSAAFRAGRISSIGVGANYWDATNIGDYSVSFGLNNLSSGAFAFTAGNSNIARDSLSIAIGASNESDDVGAITLGVSNINRGENSFIVGFNNSVSNLAPEAICIGSNSDVIRPNGIAIGENVNTYDGVSIGRDNSTVGLKTISIGLNNFTRNTGDVAIGSDNSSEGGFSTTIGRNNTTLNIYSTALGFQNTSEGRSSLTMGEFLEAPSLGETVLGRYNNIYVANGATVFDPNDRAFSVANGTSNGSRSNAMTILKGGNVGIGNTPEGLNPPNLLTLDNGAIDPLKINNLATDNTLNQILVIDGNGVVHVRDIGTLPIPAPGPGTPGGLGMVDVNSLQQAVIDQQGQINTLIQQNQDLLFRLEQLELGNNPTNP